ncbi:MAG: hypothetical protein JO038_01600 [Alphaproteobacteria bacterium]|nr:hypothetical protein [Alphaproteobacteria bacterium]
MLKCSRVIQWSSAFFGSLLLSTPGTALADGTINGTTIGLSTPDSAEFTAVGIVPPTNGTAITTTQISSGTLSATLSFNHFIITPGGTSQQEIGLFMDIEPTGSKTGKSFGIVSQLTVAHNAASGDDYIAGDRTILVNATDTSGGQFYGGNDGCIVAAGVSGIGCNALELDTALGSGSTFQYRNGLRIENEGVAQASVEDNAIVITSATNAGLFKCGICFSAQLNYMPLDSSGTVIGFTAAQSIANLIDATNLTATYLLKSTNVNISGAGQMTLAAGASIASLGVNESAPGTGNVNISGSYQVAGTAGVTCAAGTINLATAAATGGLLTHC